MANPTTNYSFQMPTASDLVTDLPADFETFGQAVDTRLKALQPGTTLGDIVYSSATANTNTRLGIGTTGQVLAVSGGVPAWTTPSVSASGMTLIARTDFSNVASQAFDNVFSSTYRTYLVIVEKLFAATAGDDAIIQMRYAGPTTQTSAYYQKAAKWNQTSWAGLSSGGSTEFSISDVCGTTADYLTAQIYFNGVGNASEQPNMNFNSNDSWSGTFPQLGAGTLATNRIYTGFLIRSSSSNVTGRVAVYGMAV